MEFRKFPKIPRLGSKHDDMVITEKIDGTNAQVCITEDGEVLAGSRNRWITPGKQTDNYGFASWVQDHSEQLLELGVGTHYGEWWGAGIQRRYGMKEKHFSLFNTFRPEESLPDCVQQVPVLYQGEFSTTKIQEVFEDLWVQGSRLCGHAFQAEGIVIYHMTSRNSFKMTYNYKDGKWNG